MSREWPSGLPAHRPEDPGEAGLITLAVTVMHVTVFFSLIGLGYPADQALKLAIAVGLGSATVAGRFLANGRNDRPGGSR
jgi:hypothetical protein